MSNTATLIEAKPGTMVGQIATQAAAHRQDLQEAAPFASLRYGNKVDWFTTGNQYFARLAAALKGAQKSIFIAGWQVNWDLNLTSNDRLIDILRDRICSSESFRLFVMPWMSPKVGVNTYDFETMLAIFQLNAGRKSMQAVCCSAGEQADYSGSEGAAFAHHQKLIVIDNEIAFIGGMDVAYGRRDDESFSLQPDTPAIPRRFNERYNPGIPPTRKTDVTRDGPTLSLMDLFSTVLSSGHWNAGGNSEPSALASYLHTASRESSRLLAKSLKAINAAAILYYQSQVDLAHGAVKTANATADLDLRIATAAAQGLSDECASIDIPNFYGALKSAQVGSEPTSSLPGAIASIDGKARAATNNAIDQLAHASRFLSPLEHLRVDPAPSQALPDLVRGTERDARGAINLTIDGAAALAKVGQDGAGAARNVCLAMGPAVAHQVDALRTEGRTLEQGASTAVREGINIFQKRLIEEINAQRETMSELLAMAQTSLASVKTAAYKSAYSGGLAMLDHLPQEALQSAIDGMMQLFRMAYVANLALSWGDAHAHPALFKPGVKQSADSVLGLGQPREPWEDIHCEIQGPAVFDVANNFVRRWSACQAQYLSDETFKDLMGLAAPGAADLAPKPTAKLASGVGSAFRTLVAIPDNLKPTLPKQTDPPAKPCGLGMRILRSAPKKLRDQEAAALGEKPPSGDEQHEIQSQMINLIGGATDFIYIENQFFQTEFGAPSIDPQSTAAISHTSLPLNYVMGSLGNAIKSKLSTAGHGADGAPGKYKAPHNRIGEALGDRIAEAVRMGLPFHVYMVLPVHPEGALDDITVMGQIHWTMQSLVFADLSLVNRIKSAIHAKSICPKPHGNAEWQAALDQARKRDTQGRLPCADVSPEAWAKYLTVLNLRNCDVIDGQVRTEQIYVHSKLLIVDDRHVVLGSANINDRSQSGRRDSEIAMALFDTAMTKQTLRDNAAFVSQSVRDLRTRLWKKHLALASGGNAIIRPASSITASMIANPASDATITAIQSLARDNAASYRKSFPFVPWSDPKPAAGASIWPVCPPGAESRKMSYYATLMPFSEEFWKPTAPKCAPPAGIEGYFTAFPLNWTMGEYNHPQNMNEMLLTQTAPTSSTSSYA